MNNDQDWPTVTVVICTYDRPVEIRKTMDSLFNNLLYPTLRWHIADDGTGGSYIQDVDKMLWNWAMDPSRVHHTVTDRKGWGANVNTALRAVESDYVYFTEDDYVLLEPLDLRPYVTMMEAAPTIGMARFGLAGHDGLTCELHETDISEWMPDYRLDNGISGKLSYWEIVDPGSRGPFGFYRYSNRPHLKHRRFHDAYGYYAEGLSLGETEHHMNGRIREVGIGPAIICPVGWEGWHYDHIGISRQGSEADKESSHATP